MCHFVCTRWLVFCLCAYILYAQSTYVYISIYSTVGVDVDCVLCNICESSHAVSTWDCKHTYTITITIHPWSICIQVMYDIKIYKHTFRLNEVRVFSLRLNNLSCKLRILWVRFYVSYVWCIFMNRAYRVFILHKLSSMWMDCSFELCKIV